MSSVLDNNFKVVKHLAFTMVSGHPLSAIYWLIGSFMNIALIKIQPKLKKRKQSV